MILVQFIPLEKRGRNVDFILISILIINVGDTDDLDYFFLQLDEVGRFKGEAVLEEDKVVEFFVTPLPSFPKLWKAEAGLGFAFAGEKLLHQPFFMLRECVHFAGLRRDRLV